MNFRKEELPACFSDAESVLSPKQNQSEPPVLTYSSQHVDVSEQPRSIGEGADDDRDGGVSNVNQGKDPGPRSKDERQAVRARLRERVSPSRWFRSTSSLRPSHEIEAMDELKTFTAAEERSQDH